MLQAELIVRELFVLSRVLLVIRQIYQEQELCVSVQETVVLH